MPKVFSWIWKSACTMNYKVFAWLLLRDRLNTRDLLQRRDWHVTDDTHCVLCPLRIYEDRLHLFLTCNFSQRIWSYLQIQWTNNNELQQIIQTAKASFGHSFFMEVLIVACRNIWLQRNGAIFRHEAPSFGRWKSGFIHDMSLLKHRMKAKLIPNFQSWLDSLL